MICKSAYCCNSCTCEMTAPWYDKTDVIVLISRTDERASLARILLKYVLSAMQTTFDHGLQTTHVDCSKTASGLQKNNTDWAHEQSVLSKNFTLNHWHQQMCCIEEISRLNWALGISIVNNLKGFAQDHGRSLFPSGTLSPFVQKSINCWLTIPLAMTILVEKQVPDIFPGRAKVYQYCQNVRFAGERRKFCWKIL